MNSGLRIMGIVNITPNSFSDGGLYNSFESCRRHMVNLISQGVECLDIGAESTAPFNDSIPEKEEWRRYRDIFSLALESIPQVPALSIDTYRPQTFRRVFDHLREKGFMGNVIWNDVSGIPDDAALELLGNLRIHYICTHNPVHRREDTGNHSQYATEGDVVEEIISCFRKRIKKLKEVLPIQKIWLDPGFGFGKKIGQNWDLIKKIPLLMKEFDGHTFLLGASRKRFLQSMIPSGNDHEKKKKSEFLHLLLCADWMRTLPLERVMIRLHNPEIALLAKNTIEVMEKKESADKTATLSP